MPSPGPSRLVAAVGSANARTTWSGIPFHLLQAGVSAGMLDGGLDLVTDTTRIRLTRGLWNLALMARGRSRGGFQYTEGFLELLWAEAPDLAGSTILNCFCLYPEAIVEDASIRKWFFIDQTLTQLFDYYEQDKVASEAVRRSAIEREAHGYAAASGIVVNSQWAQRSVVDAYGIDPTKVHVAVPGPSIDADLIRSLEPPPMRPPVSEEAPLRLVFVGKDWQRKGLDRLLRGMEIARARSAPVTLKVIGCARGSLPPELQGTLGVEWLGFIDKRLDQAGFVAALRDADVGCLLSRYEAGGIALREYHSVGLAVIGPDTGGAPEHMIDGGSVALAPDASDEEVGDTILQLASDPHMLSTMSSTSWERRQDASWSSAISGLMGIWPEGGGR